MIDTTSDHDKPALAVGQRVLYLDRHVNLRIVEVIRTETFLEDSPQAFTLYDVRDGDNLYLSQRSLQYLHREDLFVYPDERDRLAARLRELRRRCDDNHYWIERLTTEEWTDAPLGQSDVW